MTEAISIIKKEEEEFIDRWNQTRMIMYAVFQSQSTKKLKPTDILKLPWEKDFNKEELSDEEKKLRKERLQKMALEIEKKLNS